MLYRAKNAVDTQNAFAIIPPTEPRSRVPSLQAETAIAPKELLMSWLGTQPWTDDATNIQAQPADEETADEPETDDDVEDDDPEDDDDEDDDDLDDEDEDDDFDDDDLDDDDLDEDDEEDDDEDDDEDE